jgi:DNA-directed RNA polymerase omega subunit
VAFPSLEQSLYKVSNRYMLVALACKRAHQINRGPAVRVVLLRGPGFLVHYEGESAAVAIAR